MDGMMGQLGELVLAAGVIGTAAFGIVDGLKWLWIGRLGFGQIKNRLGALTSALQNAYGPDVLDLLEAQYRNGRTKGDLPKTLRQGVRVGLTPGNAGELAGYVGMVDGDKLTEIAGSIAEGTSLDSSQRGLLGRYELAVDARLDAALGLAEQSYKSGARLHAAGIAVVLALLAATTMIEASMTDQQMWELMIKAFIVGIAAVPLAPIAKDVAKALQSANKAFRLKR